MARRKHKRLVQQADLDITAFMNLMIVLVPVLLLSMVFAQTSVLNLNFPAIDESKLNLDDDSQLQLIIRHEGLRLADSKNGLIRSLDNIGGAYNFEALSKVLQQIKRRKPEKTDIALLIEENIDYQTIVTAMDVTRSYESVVVTSVVNAELFPDISIGDAPELGEKR